MNNKITDKRVEEALEYKQEIERLENNAPRYDLEYIPEADSKSGKVIEAYELLVDDLGDENYSVINTTVQNHGTVMVTVAAEVKKSTFENAQPAWLVTSGNKHPLWCQKKFNTTDEIPVLPVGDCDQTHKKYEKEFQSC